MISIIIPVYNVLPYLKRCLDSVVSQTFEDLEIIAVDDGSTDGGGEFLDEYAASHKNMRVIHRTNGGLSAARNTGLDAACGDYIGLVDSDDFIHPRMYEILMKAMLDTDSDIAICGFERINENDAQDFSFPQTDVNEIGTAVFSGKENIFAQLKERDIQTVVAWTKLYKKELFSTVRYPEGRLHEDAAVIHELLWKCDKICYAEASLYYYVQRGGGIMHDLEESAKSVSDGIKAYEDRLTFFAEKKETALYGATLELLFGNLLYKFNLFSRNGYTDECDRLSGEVRRILSGLNYGDFAEKKLLVSDIKLLAYEPKKYYHVIKKREATGKFKGAVKKLLHM